MDAERWRRLSRELDAMLDAGADERVSRLTNLRASDAELAELLHCALTADQRRIPLLDEPMLLAAESHPDSSLLSPVATAGDVVGQWRLERELGAGGMGQVWLAARDDGAYRMRVAVKLVDTRPDSELAREQLRRERQILADLDHPDIARLLDGGLRHDGTPWYAMEYIEGQPLDVYCDEAGLARDDRLRLIARIALAVHHAHTHLVVHRDLKPGNILVDGEGRPHLLDFGIAKLLDAGTIGAGNLTLLAAATPAYAAPEQLRGEQVGTAADIYALGVLTFELLTGSRPPRAAADAAELSAAPRPSRAMAGRNRRGLVGDIDAIVTCALAPRPQDRYASAFAFADDIERFLRAEPVRARRAGRRYRAAKFVRRHWLGVSSGAFAVLVLALALGNSILQTRAARAALAQSTAEQQFLLGVFDAATPLADNTGVLTQRELVDRASAGLDAMLATDHVAGVDMLLSVARVYRKLGLADRAGATLDRAEKAFAASHLPATDVRHVDLLLERGRVDYQLGHMQDAIHALQRADGLAQSARAPATLRTDVLYELGSSYSAAGQGGAALQTLAAAETLATAPNGDARRLPQILIERALAMRRMGQLDAAIVAGAAALSAAITQYGPHARRTAGIQSTLGSMYRRSGDLPQAERLLRAALATERDTFHQPQAATVNNLAHVLAEQGALAEAGSLFELALNLAIQRYGADSTTVASYRRNLALEQANAGHLTDAEANLRQAYTVYAARTPPDSVENRTMREQLARVLLSTGKFDEADALLAPLLQRTPPSGSLPTELRLAHVDAARLALARGHVVAARHHLDIAGRNLPAYGLDVPDRVAMQLLAGDVAAAAGQAKAARAQWTAALKLAQDKLGPNQPLVRHAQARLRRAPRDKS